MRRTDLSHFYNQESLDYFFFDTVNIDANHYKEVMSSYIAIFEIPALDITRAAKFYTSIFDIQIEEMEIPGMSMALFPFEGQDTVGVIVAGEEYQPSARGVTIYFHAGDDLQIVLDRVEGSGGEILMPKTPHADESGFFALLKDTEGNRIGLHSNG